VTRTASVYTAAALWPIAVYFATVLVVISSMIVISYVLGQRHKERVTDEPYASGMMSTGSAGIRFDIRFYLVAMIFVIFDLEAVFIFAWAVALRELGWAGYLEAMIFIGILIAALVYLWRLGALDLGPAGIKRNSGVSRGYEK